MNRRNRYRDDEMLRKLKEKEVVNLDDIVDIPAFDNSDLIKTHMKSIMVRILNPLMVTPLGLISALPKIWDVEGQVKERSAGNYKVQFTFTSEEDIDKVMKMAPWFVNSWLVTGQRWSPNPEADFLSKILFWVRIRGLLFHLIKDEAIRGIGDSLGKVEEIEPCAKDAESLDYVRVRVWISTDDPLIFKKAVRFDSGEIITVDLDYEKLTKVCYKCKRLTHDQYHCTDKGDGSGGATRVLEEDGEGPKGGLGRFNLFHTKELSPDLGKFDVATKMGGVLSSRGRGRGRGRGGRGRGRGRDGGSVAVITPLIAHSKAWGKRMVSDAEWRPKEYDKAPSNFYEVDDKVGNKTMSNSLRSANLNKVVSSPIVGSNRKIISSGKTVGMEDAEKLFVFEAHHEEGEIHMVTKRKRRSSAERNKAKKRAKLRAQEEPNLVTMETDSSSVASGRRQHLTPETGEDELSRRLSSGLKVSFQNRTPIFSRLVVCQKLPVSI